MAFRIIRNNITGVTADAIVSTADPGQLNTGSVTVAPASGLPAKYIISCAVPVYEDGRHGEAKLLGDCYRECLGLARGNGCRSIAFPLFSPCAYGFPEDLSLTVALDSIKAFLSEYEDPEVSYEKPFEEGFGGIASGPEVSCEKTFEEDSMEITLVVFDNDFRKVSGDLFDDVRAFADSKRFKKSHSGDKNFFGKIAERLRSGQSPACGSVPNVPPAADSCALSEEPSLSFESCAVSEKSSLSLDDRLKGMYTDTFAKHLQQLINKKGLRNSEVYTNANITKQYFSKLMKGSLSPSKEKVLSLAISLKLNLDETVDFLRLAGYALSPVSQTDVIVEYFITKKNFDIYRINIVLFDYGLPTLSD